MFKSNFQKYYRLGRVLLLILFIAVAMYAATRCLVQAPEQTFPASDAISTTTEFDDRTDEDAAAAEALRKHTERKENFYTILVSGIDDENGGSDTNILVAIDAEVGYIYGVSIPRDTKAIIHGEAHKINFAYNSGGTELLADVVSDQLGIPIDYTIQVDLQGFIALVDAVGGITFDVPMDMKYEDPYQDLYIDIPKGVQRLNGEDALKVVRFRSGYASQDIGRMQTQQAFLKAAAKQILTLSNIDDLIKVFRTYVKTDLTTGNLAWLAEQALMMGIENIEFSTLPNEWISPYIHLNQGDTLALINTYLNPYVEDRVPEDLNIPD